MNISSVVLSIVLVLSLSLPSALSYIQEVNILEQKEIVRLDDEKLVETYIDVIVEMEASKTFHTTSGFTPKQYAAYKNLLRYRIKLLMEIQKRGLQPPLLNQ